MKLTKINIDDLNTLETGNWDFEAFNLENNKTEGLATRLKSKRRKYFIIPKSIRTLAKILGGNLPSGDECIKLISFDGGFASISFICHVAEKENILELTASTLRIGEKQLGYLAGLHKAGRLLKATFFIGSIMREDEKKEDAYNYYGHFKTVCMENGWDEIIINNHSKIILMRTAENWYVLETSSNLNENPKIEQFSFENDKTLYDFYYDFFQNLK